MKSIETYINEAKKNKVSFEYDESPEWNKMTCGVDYAGEPVIIFGKPCSRGYQEEWDNNYKMAKEIAGNNFTMSVHQKLQKAFKEIEDDLGEELDKQQCLCICYIPSADDWAVYVYGGDGVLAIK